MALSVTHGASSFAVEKAKFPPNTTVAAVAAAACKAFKLNALDYEVSARLGTSAGAGAGAGAEPLA